MAANKSSRTLSSAEASFVHFFRAVVAAGFGPGEREKRQRAVNAGKEKERREASCSRPFPLPIVPRAPSIIQKFPVGGLCGGERFKKIRKSAPK